MILLLFSKTNLAGLELKNHLVMAYDAKSGNRGSPQKTDYIVHLGFSLLRMVFIIRNSFFLSDYFS